jgi:hypothetical protein
MASGRQIFADDHDQTQIHDRLDRLVASDSDNTTSQLWNIKAR